MVLDGEADLAIATEALDEYDELVTLPGYQWHHCVVVPEGHPLARVKPLTLEAIARYPIVTYDPTFAGRTADRPRLRRARPRARDRALRARLRRDQVVRGAGPGRGDHLVSAPSAQGKDEGLVALDCGAPLPGADHAPRLQARRLPARLHGGVHPPLRAAPAGART